MFFFFAKMLARKIAPKISAFFKHFISFFKQIKKIGVEGFFYLLTFHRGGNENLKKKKWHGLTIILIVAYIQCTIIQLHCT